MYPRISSSNLIYMLVTVCSSSSTYMGKTAIDFVPLISNQIDVETLGFCEDFVCNSVKDYPMEYLRQKLGVITYYHGRGGHVVQAYEPQSSEDFKTSRSMCETSRHYMTPMAAKNMAHEWKYIVQIGDQYQQKLEYDICKHGNECFAKSYLPYDYTTRCEQTRVIAHLLTVHANGTISMDRYPIPAGCSCTYARTLKK